MTRAIILARVSDEKQKIYGGDSLDDQVKQCQRFIDGKGWTLAHSPFVLIESGRTGERTYFKEVFEYCKSKSKTSEKIDYLVVLNIGRFTRAGGVDYLRLKKEYEDIGVQITDSFGTVGQKVNTLQEYGFEYDWSKYSPTESAEIHEADQKRDQVRDILTQTVSGCIRNINKGYWNGPAPFGLITKKIETANDGVRSILEGRNSESLYITKILEMRADGYPDTETVKVVNAMGYKTRTMVKRDKRTKLKIGTKGGVPLTVKKIQEYAVNPIYCGVIVAKWTHEQPIKAQMFDGIVSVDTFNRASRGKVFVTKNNDGSVQVKYNIKFGSIGNGDKRLRNNPNYPFKSVIRCPHCGKEVKASSSRGRSGEKFPSYFCDRKHPRWHKKLNEVHETVENYIGELKFSDSFINFFDEVFTEVWDEKRIGALQESKLAENNVAELVEKQKNVLESIKSSTSNLVKKALEDDYEKLEVELTEARTNRDNKESTELDIKSVLSYANYLMEHPKELLIDKDNMLNQRQMFGTVFEELPTYDNLTNGTAKLQPIFQLKENENVSKVDLVQRVGVEPTYDSFTDCCLTVRLPLV